MAGDPNDPFSSVTDPGVRSLLQQLVSGQLSPQFADEVAAQFQSNEFIPNLNKNATQFASATAPFYVQPSGNEGNPNAGFDAQGNFITPGNDGATPQQLQEFGNLTSEFAPTFPKDPGGLADLGALVSDPVLAAAFAAITFGASTGVEAGAEGAGAAAGGTLGEAGTSVAGGEVAAGAAGTGGAALGAGATVAPSAAIEAGAAQTGDVLSSSIAPTSDTAAGGFAAGTNPDVGLVPGSAAANGSGIGDGAAATLGDASSISGPTAGQQGADTAATTGFTQTGEIAGDQLTAALNQPDNLSTVLGSSSEGPLAFSPPDPAASGEIGGGGAVDQSSLDISDGEDPNAFESNFSEAPPPVSTSDLAPFGGSNPIQGAINADNTPLAADQNAALAGGGNNGLFDKAISYVGNNPMSVARLAVPALGLGTTLARGESKLPGSATTLANAGDTLNATSASQLALFNSGQLTPGQLAQIQTSRQQQISQVYQQLASQGVSDPTKDSRYIQAVQQIENNAQVQTQQFLDATLQSGLAAAGAAGQDLAAAAQIELSRDSEFQSALNAAMASFGTIAAFSSFGRQAAGG